MTTTGILFLVYGIIGLIVFAFDQGMETQRDEARVVSIASSFVIMVLFWPLAIGADAYEYVSEARERKAEKRYSQFKRHLEREIRQSNEIIRGLRDEANQRDMFEDETIGRMKGLEARIKHLEDIEKGAIQPIYLPNIPGQEFVVTCNSVCDTTTGDCQEIKEKDGTFCDACLNTDNCIKNGECLGPNNAG